MSKVSISKKEFVREHRKLVRILREGTENERLREAGEQEKELRKELRK